MGFLIGIVSSHPQETIEASQSDRSESHQSDGFLHLFKLYGSDESVEFIDTETKLSCESEELDESEEATEFNEFYEYSDFNECPGGCIKTIDDFIAKHWEDGFMHYLEMYRCTMDSIDCHNLLVDAVDLGTRSKRDDSISSTSKIINIFAEMGLYFAQLFG